MTLIERIKKFFNRKQEADRKQEEMLFQLAQANQITNNHLIALARLLFIKPETLLREAKNVKSNGEYLLKLMELEMKEQEERKQHVN